jgi:hypothetical protein
LADAAQQIAQTMLCQPDDVLSRKAQLHSTRASFRPALEVFNGPLFLLLICYCFFQSDSPSHSQIAQSLSALGESRLTFYDLPDIL